MWGEWRVCVPVHIPYIAQKDGRSAGSNSENCTENARRQTSVSVKHQPAAKTVRAWVE